MYRCMYVRCIGAWVGVCMYVLNIRTHRASSLSVLIERSEYTCSLWHPQYKFLLCVLNVILIVRT